MKYSLLISFFVVIIAYPTNQVGTKSPVGDEINIDGKNHTIPDAIDIQTVVPPEPPFTPSHNITTTTVPSTTTNTTNSTTASPTTPTTPITPPTNVTTPVTPTNGTTATTPIPKPTNATTPSTTPIAPTSSSGTTTVKPVPTTEKPEPERRFDGPSFVGGIVLALGLVAIGFVAFKFYKARTELNYHTL